MHMSLLKSLPMGMIPFFWKQENLYQAANNSVLQSRVPIALFSQEERSDELAKLQDQVPPFESRRVRETLERSYGRVVETVFQAFDFTPVASASVAQVHLATLPDGREVAVKILRPGIRAVIVNDLALLHDGDQQDDQHRGREHERLAHVAEHEVDRRRGGEQQEHRLACDLERNGERAAPAGDRQRVRAIFRETLARLGTGQSGRRKLTHAKQCRVGSQCAIDANQAGPRTAERPCTTCTTTTSRSSSETAFRN